MKQVRQEKGQALILIALAAVGLFGFAALAIDGSMAFSDKRHAQNAADSASLAAALAHTRGSDINAAATTRATSNGYDGGTMNDVTVTITDIAEGSGLCPGDTAGKQVTVTIMSIVNTTFARVIGREQITNTVTATSQACGYYRAPLFNGYPIVGLNPNQDIDPRSCGFTTGNSGSAEWEVEGGGVFSNGCAFAKNPDSVNFHTGGDPDCASAVGPAGTFDCQEAGQTHMLINYPADVDAIMPPNPCDGTAGDIGLPPPASGSVFSNGVYCISNLDAYDSEDIILNNATLYVTDANFDLKFAGGGGFWGFPTQEGGYTGSDPYVGYYMVVARTSPPCPDFAHGNQVIEWRGNGTGSFQGTVLAPSACLDVRGNGDPAGMNTQLIAYVVGSNGNADVYINYNPDDNHLEPVFPSITLLR
jgi:Flp pilus assembly protein TadG